MRRPGGPYARLRAMKACPLGAVVLLVATSALAQDPDAEWGTFPGDGFNPPPVSAPPPPLPVAPVPAADVAPRAWRARPPEEPNLVSMFGAPMLGPWKRGQSFAVGFPLLAVRASIGIFKWLEAGLGFDSFYGSLNEPRVRLKAGGISSAEWTFAATLEGGAAFFTQRAAREVRGGRWITGRRNFNLSPSLLASYQGPHPRAARLFIELRYTLAFDTEPFAANPLEGVPPSLVLGHNVLLQVGAEMPLSAKSSFVFLLGLDFHGRAIDSLVMPACSVGLVTGF